MQQLNDSLRAAFLPSGVRCFLIKSAPNSGTKWIVVKELTSGWFIEFSEYRVLFKLLYATLDEAFSDEIAQTTFVAYGVPDADNQMEVFAIDPERRDVIPPTGSTPFWKIYVDKEPKKRFLIP